MGLSIYASTTLLARLRFWMAIVVPAATLFSRPARADDSPASTARPMRGKKWRSSDHAKSLAARACHALRTENP
jgi:hypothetical protein